jgi:predicted acylesterase/phospholipase RssA
LAWIWLAGSYSYARDLAVILVATLVSIRIFSRGRSLVSILGSPPRAQIWFQVFWLILAWTLVSIADRVGESGVLAKRGAVVAPAAMPDRWKGLRVGLSLSGGGYRAAVVHAGVLFELGKLGVPVTNLSSVSGGSLIGAFVAAGGSPEDFAQAVDAGRFRLARDLTWIWNVARLATPVQVPLADIKLWPFGSFSRLDVQAELIDRVLLSGFSDRTASAESGPALIVNSTDLRYGFSVGFSNSGLLLAGPVVNALVVQSHINKQDVDLFPAYFRYGQSLRTVSLPRLAERVAISGAFPGAFPTTPIDLELLPTSQVFHLSLALADGGVRDNLGINSLLLADLLARIQQDPARNEKQAWKNDPIDPGWKLDLLLSSNGGQALQTASELSSLASVVRAIELNGLETGPVRLLPGGEKPSIIMLSDNATLAFSPDMIVLGNSPDDFKKRPESFIGHTTVDDKGLVALAEIADDQSIVRSIATTFREAGDQGSVDCKDAISTPYACRRRDLVRAVGDDIWRAYVAFREKPTLDDSFTSEEVHKIFRFGRYLVRMRAKEVVEALDKAQRLRDP